MESEWSESKWSVQEETHAKTHRELESLTNEGKCGCVSGGVLKVTLILNMRN